MSNIVDLYAETGATLIGDDAQPALTVTNSSTGPGLSTNRLLASNATIPNLTSSNYLGSAALSSASIAQLNINTAILAANATVAGLNILGASAASGAAIGFRGDALVSAVSIVFAASANWAGLRVARVVLADGTFGWIPILPNAVVTAAAL